MKKVLLSVAFLLNVSANAQVSPETKITVLGVTMDGADVGRAA